ncbi:hypothetical protein H9L19_05890 [Weissella diestrammenae]|uniref:Uncharacterized protein n=1 Tax=Weissella diestrammenae TaxID=1162633 RepID=A0A7G9T496_9LACO|nr:hypothetical protein [Weissella diestrammenae]MCM0583452.1 hypothetical protein [Weissella diestrammenae]QNN74921.1 hypothetical protein H9L19_05890 [Weissella diestrammenae]
MIIAVEIVFAILILGLGIGLIVKRRDLMGLSEKQIKGTAIVFGVWFILMGLGIFWSIIVFGDAPWPVTGFLVSATLTTTILAMIISQKIFK